MDLTQRALIMGVLNLTPDSFSDGGAWIEQDRAIAHGLQMQAEGAAILDVGGESTRPGAEPVSEAEELRRVIPVIESLAQKTSTLISIDTRKVAVAREALRAGAAIVNDISGLQDPEMRELIRNTRAGAIAMHMQGSPADMQSAPCYQNVVQEIRSFFSRTLALCQNEGIAAEQLLFDPGIGFGKTVEHNTLILKNLHELGNTGRPLALGVSRKSFLAKLTGASGLEDRSWPTVALSSYARNFGVVVLRVHEVLANVQATRMTEAILEGAA